MGNLQKKLLAEVENIDKVFLAIPDYSKLPYLSALELAGVAALLHNFYNGIEDILKQILISKNVSVPGGVNWHKQLMEISIKEGIITDRVGNVLNQYLAFRHYFSHAYALDLFSDKMVPLVENASNVYSLFKDEIRTFLE